MQLSSWFLALVFFFTLCFAPAQSVEIATADGGIPKLVVQVQDDFLSDTRAQYSIDNSVTWVNGALVLGKGGAVSRSVETDAWVELECDFKIEDPEKAVQFNVSITFDSEDELQVIWEQDGKTDNSTRTLTVLFGKSTEDPNQLEKWSLPKIESGNWRVVYRYGVILIVPPDGKASSSKHAFVARYGANPTRVQLRSAERIRLTELRIAAASKRPQLSREQKQLKRRFDSLKEGAEAAKHGTVSQQVTRIEEMSNLAKQIWGEYHPAFLVALNDLGGAYLNSRNLTKCVEASNKFRELNKHVHGDSPILVSVIRHLAQAEQLRGDFRAAEKLYGEARELGYRIDATEYSHFASTLMESGGLQIVFGRFSKSEQLVQEARRICERVHGKQSVDYARATSFLGAVYDNMTRGDLAEPLYIEAENVFKREPGVESHDYSANLQQLADLYLGRGELTKAEQLYLRVKDIRKKIFGDDHPTYGKSVRRLGRVYLAMGDYAAAEPMLVKARDIAKTRLGVNSGDYIDCLNRLGLLYYATREFDKSARCFEEVYDITMRVQPRIQNQFAAALGNLAAVYAATGDFVRVKPLLYESLRLLEKDGEVQDRDIGPLLNNIGRVHQILGEEEQALSKLEKALVHAAPQSLERAGRLNNLASFHMLFGSRVRAAAMYKEAIDIRLATARHLIPHMSDAQAQRWMMTNRPPSDGLLSSLRSAEVGNMADLYETVWRTKALIARLRDRDKLEADASPEAKRAFANLRDARIRLSQLVMAKPPENQVAAFKNAISRLNARKETLEKELASVSAKSRVTLAARGAGVSDLVALLPLDTAIVDLVRGVDLHFPRKRIQFRSLKGELIETESGEEEWRPVYDAFVVRRDSENKPQISWVQLGDAKEIDDQIRQWRADLTNSNALSKRGSDRNVPQAVLRRLIWDKLEPHLKGVRRIVVLPDGDLNKVPWLALPGRRPDTFLIEDYAICTASYGQQIYKVLSSEPVRAGGLLVGGGIDYGQNPTTAATADSATQRGKWAPLKGAQREAKFVFDIWRQGRPAKLLDGRLADEASLIRELPKSQFVHLATHGFFSDPDVKSLYHVDLRISTAFETNAQVVSTSGTVAGRNPLLLSGLVLSGANIDPPRNSLGIPVGPDGILTAEEFIGLDLRNTELITLSACETGLGDVAAGEGVSSLQRALSQAGARSVVATLWKIDDLATQVLMRRFYTNLWVRKMGKLASLREAQLWMLKNPKALKDLGIKVRGSVGSRKPKASPDNENPIGKTEPLVWAAFQLSGDWR